MPIENSIGFGDSDGSIGTQAIDLIAASGTRRLTEYFDFSLGRPGTSAESYPADIGASQAVSLAYAQAVLSQWTLSGTNAAAANVTRPATGGLTLTTAGASGDQMVISPNKINGVFMNGLGGTVWRPDSGLIFRALITTPATITDIRILIGLKLAFSTTTGAEDHDSGATITDDDYVLFAFDTSHASSASYWHLCAGNNGVDVHTVADTFKTLPVAASKRYLLEIAVDGDDVPHFMVNGADAGSLAALRSGSVLLLPFFGIQALTGAARSLTVEGGEVSIAV